MAASYRRDVTLSPGSDMEKCGGHPLPRGAGLAAGTALIAWLIAREEHSPW